jgi:lysophospholipase L1-like esterase
MKKLLYLLIFILVGASFTSCEPEFTSPIGDESYSSGDADFSKFVSVGNSLTAGYTNGTLYKSGQELSFPAILANQMKLAGGGEFTQPYLADDSNDVGGMIFAGNTILAPKLIVNASQGSVERINRAPSIDITDIHPGPYNNMGVPGAKVFHLGAAGYGNLANVPIGAANPYYVRMASAPNTPVIADAVAQNPTFFTLWIGANDVLAFATSGGLGVDQTGNFDPTTYGANDITDPMVFAGVYSQLLDALTANGAKGVVATIPDVASVPYFTTIPYNPIPMTDQATVDALNNAYLQYNGGLQVALANGLIDAAEASKRTIVFAMGANAMVIEDEDLTDLSGLGLPSIRQTNTDDLVVLPAKSVIGQADPNNPSLINGITKPLADQWVLTDTEINSVRTATAAYNGTINQLAAAKDIPVADMAATMAQMINGLKIEDGSVYTADYFNGANLDNLSFGLDGVHPNSRGYAIIANKFIDVINSKYNATLPKVVPAGYPTITILGSN